VLQSELKGCNTAMPSLLDAKLDVLESKGVTIIDRRQTYLDSAIDAGRICAGAVLFPGTRLVGARTFLGPGAKVGSEGPAVLENTFMGENAEIASGYVKEAVLLRSAKVGANAHIRPRTLLEEEASTAHAVGLKHTILMSFVAMGSLVNFCDALISGGSSRKKHTEVGSGFIHFNYTPRGESGDKATPSLIGDVARGVFLRQPRIFLGGLSGIAGPQKIGFGSFTVAGQVVRREVLPHKIFGDTPRKVDKELAALVDSPNRIVKLNLEYIGNLFALRTWYQNVRLSRIPTLPDYEHLRIVTQAASELLSVCIDERVERLRSYLEERNLPLPPLSFGAHPCPLNVKPDTPYVDHVKWVSGLSDADVQRGASWLQSIVENA
jgi:hypothetical protein